MSAAVSQLLTSLHQLTPRERVEFFSLVAAPVETMADNGTDDEFSMTAAQTFARLDAGEEEHAGCRS